ncbi:tRNA (adenosine(37)-N6)-threonylcarbamoyltransferase complex ATPase subunit type 1 TsaE [Desulfobaculum sp. SPO524]|uniref:tRNA (adenosine(37)-N6)-threonylcarbamoyltransferase complex ATPase subunit type 1 TsaE n=1 Tax=Desulfobaculum sp. SPO524 TaxID=3378071 RepID=UPI003851E416
MTITVHLEDEAATLALGQRLARAVADDATGLNVLLCGELGAGKTTLVRGLVAALPGGEDARVSSPSFNIMNLYPTTPETAHFDLYRLEFQEPDESLLEFLADDETLVLVEWSQYLDREFWPGDYLLLTWQPAQTGRTLELTAQGATATAILRAATHEG